MSRDDEERRLFEAAMKDVRPLAPGPSRVVPDWETAGPSAPTRPRATGAKEALHLGEDGSSGTAAGVAHDLVRALSRGEISPEARLDLHHQSAEVAAHSVQRFVEASVARRRRCVLLIHGQGHRSGPAGPVLRDVVIQQLRQAPTSNAVLAFVSAPAQHGGPGSLLVLLRRSR